MRIRPTPMLASLLAALCPAMFCFPANAADADNISLQLATNAVVAWQAPLDQLPKELWTYKRLSPRRFSAAVVSNAMVLASLQDKGIPKPSTNRFCIDLDKRPWGHVATFTIDPESGRLDYTKTNFNSDSTGDIPSDAIIVQRAWDSAAMLELDPAQLKQVAPVDHFCSYNEKGRPLSNWDEKNRRITNGAPCGRTVFLARVLDGIRFIGDGEEGWETEGFTIQVGSHGQLREFSLVWPALERQQKQPPASPRQMLDFIRAGKAFVLPGPNEPAFLQRLRLLSTASKLTVTNMTLYYCDGRFGQVGRREPSPWVTPFALIGASAEISGTNATLQLACPILQSDVVLTQ